DISLYYYTQKCPNKKVTGEFNLTPPVYLNLLFLSCLSKIHFSVTTITVCFCILLCFLFIMTCEVFIFILFITVLSRKYSVINIFRYILPHWPSRLHIISWLFRRMFMSILIQ